MSEKDPRAGGDLKDDMQVLLLRVLHSFGIFSLKKIGKLSAFSKPAPGEAMHSAS